jgi:hypothetical protein
MDQAIPFDRTRWQQVLSGVEPEVASLPDELEGAQISRARLLELGAEAMKQANVVATRRAYFGMLMFGWGTQRDGGPRNAERALAHPVALDVSLQTTIDHLSKGAVEAAYSAVRISGCGASFVSKLVYTLGRWAMKNEEYPLILDSAVAAALDRLMGTPVEQVHAFVPYQLRPWPAGYSAFVTDMHAWSRALQVEPDQLEHFLWKPPTALAKAAIAYYD